MKRIVFSPVQQVFHDFSDSVSRQWVSTDLPVRGNLVVGKAFGHPLSEFAGIESPIRLRHNNGLYLLAEFLVIDTNNGRFCYVRVGKKAMLDFSRVDVLGAP